MENQSILDGVILIVKWVTFFMTTMQVVPSLLSLASLAVQKSTKHVEKL